MGEQLRTSVLRSESDIVQRSNIRTTMREDSSTAVATSWSLAVGGLTLAEVHQLAGLVVMTTSFVYTLWRWNRDIKNDR